MDKFSLELSLALVGFVHVILYAIMERSGKIHVKPMRLRKMRITNVLLIVALVLILINILSDPFKLGALFYE